MSCIRKLTLVTYCRGWHGPFLVTRVVGHFCPTISKAREMNYRRLSPKLSILPEEDVDREELCGDLVVFDEDRFYAVRFPERWRLDNDWRHECALFETLRERSVGFHLWKAIPLEKKRVTDSVSTLQARVLERACPFTDPMNLREISI
jgi:hypothetical protein